MEYKYSLIIPVYQVKEYITKCLDSILSQIPHSVQIILVDDGSTDGSGEICDWYAKEHLQIEVYHHENKGVAATRNVGLFAAKGEYLIWVDPDDWVANNWFEMIDEEIEANAADIIVFDYYRVENEHCIPRYYGRASGNINKEVFLNDVVRDLRLNSSLWNKVIKRKLFDGIIFDEKLKCLEDYAILHLLIMRAQFIRYLSVPLYYYLIRPSGLIRSGDLTTSYQSYCISLQRIEDIEKTGRNCEVLGSILQAKEFCRNFYLAKMPTSQETRYCECKRMIQKNLLLVLADKELTIRQKLTCVLMPFKLVGTILRRRNDLGRD